MKILAFKTQMYRCILDSGWIEVNPLTVLVGKNESGKTSVLRALHKFNPFKPDPYVMDNEWPRGHRRDRDDEHVVCTVRFELSDKEISALSKLTEQNIDFNTIEISKDYRGRFEVIVPREVFPDRLHPTDIDNICASLPSIPEAASNTFKDKATELADEARRLAHEGRFSDLPRLQDDQIPRLRQATTNPPQDPSHQQEQEYINQYQSKLGEISQKLSSTLSIQGKAHEYIIKNLPTFIYMSDYRTFSGGAHLDQVKHRKDKKQLSEEDRTLLTIMELSGLDLDDVFSKGNKPDREQRQYDIDDAAATLSREISDRWKQQRYEVKFRVDGQNFHTFVKDNRDLALIKLEERSKGFQWFFSFDLMFMHESEGEFVDCVILLDEPGLHLHPDAQRDLLIRLEEYAKGNTLIYTTHLPFMIDLQRPERIRVMNEVKEKGVTVSDNLIQSQPEAKFVLQAALGMSGSTSYLLSERNLVVEGVDDFWILTELSRLMRLSKESAIPEDVFITPAGGASEAGYIATIMIGQKLQVVVILDSDKAGDETKKKLVEKWLTKYNSNPANVFSLGECVGVNNREFSIEDLFPDDFYLERVKRIYSSQYENAGINALECDGNDQICKRVERALNKHKITFNKGSVAKAIRSDLAAMNDAGSLPKETKEMARKLFQKILTVLPEEEYTR